MAQNKITYRQSAFLGGHHLYMNIFPFVITTQVEFPRRNGHRGPPPTKFVKDEKIQSPTTIPSWKFNMGRKDGMTDRGSYKRLCPPKNGMEENWYTGKN